MATIVQFAKDDASFDPKDIRAMCMAVDDVCKALSIPDNATQAREDIAIRVIALARCGERSPTRLRDRLLQQA